MSRLEFTDKRVPVYTIIGGVMYDTTPDLGVALRRWSRRYTGENYAYFRIYDSCADGKTYRPAVYSKMPVCIFQFPDEAVAIRYEPVVGDQIPSVALWADGDGCHFEYSASMSHLMKTKDTPHLGSWQQESTYKPEISSLPEFSVMRAPNWWQIVRQVVEEELAEWHGMLSTREIQASMSMANAFHDRLFDAVNCVHLEAVYHDRPERYSDAIFNNPSFEACRVTALFRYGQSNHPKCRRIARRLVFDHTLSVQLRELGACRVWHNGFQTVEGSSSLYGCTTFGTGYSGYPGGMATLMRKLLEYAHDSGSDDLLPRLRQGVDWLVLVQRDDGSFPFTVPSFAELGGPRERAVTGPNSKALGGAAEAARALVWAFKVFGNEEYLQAAEKALHAINPVPPLYKFRGYGDLRDASAYETDATSGINLANANLDLYEVTGKEEYLEAAKVLACYVLTWHNWWRTPTIDPYGFIDPMAESFCPHISPWNTLLASELYSRLYAAAGDPFWQKLAEFAFARAVSLQNPATGGISEAYNLKMLDEITTMGAESGMVTWGILDAGCALLNNRGEPFVCSKDGDIKGGLVTGGFEVGASVVFLNPQMLMLPTRRSLRRIKPLVKRLVKYVFGARDMPWMRKTGHTAKPPSSLAPKTRREYALSFRGPGELKQGMGFTLLSDKGRMVTRLAALDHNPRVKRVYLPVIHFDSEIQSAEPVRKIGETITACAVHLSDGAKLIVEFLDGTTGMGVNAVHCQGKSLLCDVTLKAGWQYGGECVQVFRLIAPED